MDSTIIAALIGLLGVVIGVLGTYFFTRRNEEQQKEQQKEDQVREDLLRGVDEWNREQQKRKFGGLLRTLGPPESRTEKIIILIILIVLLIAFAYAMYAWPRF
mgnify:CR=1 FL=1